MIKALFCYVFNNVKYKNEMLKLWLADKVIDAVGNENDYALKWDTIEVAHKPVVC